MRDMTLEEMGEHDIENLTYVMKETEEHSFANPVVAEAFVKESLTSILNKCGVAIDANSDADEADTLMSNANVKVEKRRYQDEDMWRSGLYVYKDNEIAGFVSLLKRTSLGFFKVRSTEAL